MGKGVDVVASVMSDVLVVLFFEVVVNSSVLMELPLVLDVFAVAFVAAFVALCDPSFASDVFLSFLFSSSPPESLPESTAPSTCPPSRPSRFSTGLGGTESDAEVRWNDGTDCDAVVGSNDTDCTESEERRYDGTDGEPAVRWNESEPKVPRNDADCTESDAKVPRNGGTESDAAVRWNDAAGTESDPKLLRNAGITEFDAEVRRNDAGGTDPARRGSPSTCTRFWAAGMGRWTPGGSWNRIGPDAPDMIFWSWRWSAS